MSIQVGLGNQLWRPTLGITHPSVTHTYNLPTPTPALGPAPLRTPLGANWTGFFQLPMPQPWTRIPPWNRPLPQSAANVRRLRSSLFRRRMEGLMSGGPALGALMPGPFSPPMPTLNTRPRLRPLLSVARRYPSPPFMPLLQSLSAQLLQNPIGAIPGGLPARIGPLPKPPASLGAVARADKRLALHKDLAVALDKGLGPFDRNTSGIVRELKAQGHDVSVKETRGAVDAVAELTIDGELFKLPPYMPQQPYGATVGPNAKPQMQLEQGVETALRQYIGRRMTPEMLVSSLQRQGLQVTSSVSGDDIVIRGPRDNGRMRIPGAALAGYDPTAYFNSPPYSSSYRPSDRASLIDKYGLGNKVA